LNILGDLICPHPAGSEPARYWWEGVLALFMRIREIGQTPCGHEQIKPLHPVTCDIDGRPCRLKEGYICNYLVERRKI